MLVKLLAAAGMQHKVLAAPPSCEGLVALRLSALVVDPSLLGPPGWSYLETLAGRLPNLGLVICTPARPGRPAGARATAHQLLAEREGQVLPREEIYERVWGYSMAHGDRSVDVFVRKLRQKLERVSPGWRYIHTHFGIGYRFAAEPAGAAAAPAGRPGRQDVLLSA